MNYLDRQTGSSLTLKAVTQLTGLNEHTLRAWETRYGAVKPSRTPSGRRVYHFQDVERLKKLIQLVQGGNAISQVAHLDNPAIDQLLHQLGQLSQSSVQLPEAELEQFLHALQNFNLLELSQQLHSKRARMSSIDFIYQILSPLFQTIGLRVQAGQLSIAQEHAISAIIRDQISQILFASQNNLPSTGPSLTLSTLEGDFHEFGILLASAICSIHSFRSHYFGTNLPWRSLLETTKIIQPKVLVIGTSPTAVTQLKAAESIRSLRKELPMDQEIWIGGALADVFEPTPGVKLIRSLREFENKLKLQTHP